MASIVTNLSGLIAQRHYVEQTQAVNRSIHRLATGKRINRAADDPSGLIAADEFARRGLAIRKQIEGLERAEKKAAASEGTYSAIGDLLIELDALTIQAANTGASSKEEREALQIEADGIIEAIEFVVSTSTFNGASLFEGVSLSSLGSINGSVSPDAEAQTFTLNDLKTGGALNLVDGNTSLAQELVRSTLGGNSDHRANLGNLQKNFYDREIDALYKELESVAGAESIIRDTDYAKEVSELVRAQVLQEAALKVILISRDQARNTALSLLS